MPIPLIPIISALAAGGALVPHAAGGLIVSGAGGYVAGTFLSTAAISTLITTSSITLGAVGAGVLYISGAAAGLIGSAGIFGTGVGATGLKGVLISLGVITTTPIWIPITIACLVLGCLYGSYRFYKMKRRINNAIAGQEVNFSDIEAKVIENIIWGIAKKGELN